MLKTKKYGVMLLLASLLILALSSLSVEAATCSISAPAVSDIISGSSVLFNTTVTLSGGDANASNYGYNLTDPDGNTHAIQSIINLPGAGVNNVSLINATIDSTAFAEQSYTVEVFVYNDSEQICTDTNTGVVSDNADISTPTIIQGPNSSEILEQGDGPVLFNVTSGTTNEQINSAKLLVAGNTHTMTVAGYNNTNAFISLQESQIPSGTYTYTITVTDTDGTTTATASRSSVTFDFDTGSNAGKLLAKDIIDEQSKSGLSLTTIAIIVFVGWLVFRKKR